MKRQKTVLTVVALVALAGAAWVGAGPLEPTPGPIGPTMKTLHEVEPRVLIGAATTPGDADSVYRITQPGSYYLGGNIQGVAGRRSIEIAASNVSVDLNGFVINGGGTGIGMASDAFTAITVRNGTISGCAGGGINLQNMYNCRVEKVRLRSCSERGIMAGPMSTISDCQAIYCGQGGIIASPGATIRSCTVTSCQQNGFALGGESLVIDCIARDNESNGFLGSGLGSVLTNCLAGGNGDDGFALGQKHTVEGCTAVDNGQIGFDLADTCTIRECSAMTNTAQGIHVTNYCTVLRNKCGSNGVGAAVAAGLWVDGVGNRAEDNEATGNDYGVYVEGTDNILIRNSARANALGNYVIPAGNEAATVVTNPGTNGFATANPWSNLAY